VEPEVLALERQLSERLGLRIGIKQAGRGGQLTIRYRDLDQLDGVIRLLQGG
jgi:ParB family chromosome partitioning protein